MTANLVALWYLVASVCFILALKGLSHPETARRGNAFGILWRPPVSKLQIQSDKVELSNSKVASTVTWRCVSWSIWACSTKT